MKTNMTCQQKRDLLDSFAGKYYSIDWVKSNGEARQATVQHMQHKMFVGGHASKANVSTVAHKPEMYTCVDVAKQGWVNVNLNTLKHVKCGNVEIEFGEES